MPTHSKLPQSFDASRLEADLDRIVSGEWTPHFNTQYYTGDWSAVSLRSLGGETHKIYPDPASTLPWLDTELLRRCLYVPEVLGAIECEKESVRFLRLGAGAAIREHKDFKLSLEEGVARLHLPVSTNPKVEFYLNNELIYMKEGELWYIDFSINHRVVNNGDTDRIHLVVDCIVNDWLIDQVSSGATSQGSFSPDGRLPLHD